MSNYEKILAEVTPEQKAYLVLIKSKVGVPVNVTIRQLIQKAMDESKGKL